jgi:hypothetical protein
MLAFFFIHSRLEDTMTIIYMMWARSQQTGHVRKLWDVTEEDKERIETSGVLYTNKDTYTQLRFERR